MTDRELLEAAAKAAGLKIDKSEFNGGGRGNTGFDCMGNAVLDWHNGRKWNPLTSDADAFRLMVDCYITVHVGRHGARAEAYDFKIMEYGSGVNELYEKHNNDKHAATRRAIVRAAAGD